MSDDPNTAPAPDSPSLNVTHNIAAPGYSHAGSPTALGLPTLSGPDGRTWESLDDLAEYCLVRGITAIVTPCEHTGGTSHYGSGGYRYLLHDQSFRWPANRY